MSKLGVIYGEYNKVCSSLDSAIGVMESDKNKLNYIQNIVNGLGDFGISAALGEVEKTIKSLNEFSSDFFKLGEDISTYDNDFAKGFKECEIPETLQNSGDIILDKGIPAMATGENGAMGDGYVFIKESSRALKEFSKNMKFSQLRESLKKMNFAQYKDIVKANYKTIFDYKYVDKKTFLKGTYLFEGAKNGNGIDKLDKLGNLGKAVGYAGAVVDVGSKFVDNVKKGESGSKIAADVIVDSGRNLGGMAVGVGAAKIGAALGTALFPGVGSAIGGAVGAVVGFAVSSVTSSLYNKTTNGLKFGKNKKTLSEIASDGIKGTIDWAGSLVGK